MKTDEWEIILYLYYYMFLKTCSNLLSYYCLWDSPSYECKCVKYTKLNTTTESRCVVSI